MRHIPIAVATAFVLTACSPVPPGEGVVSSARSACFFPQAIVNFRTEDTLAYVRSSRGETFRLTTGGCRDLGAARSLSIVPLDGGGSVCAGEAVNLGVSAPTLSGTGPTPCRATVTGPLSEADLAALPSRLRP